jgi:hypothetical protein
MSNQITLGHLEVCGSFRQNLGPRFMSAGLRLQFRYDQPTRGIHFKADVSEEYRGSIIKGIKEGMSARFPDFAQTGSVWITEATEHPVDSSQWAFYLAARGVIEQAYALTQLKYQQSPKQTSND